MDQPLWLEQAWRELGQKEGPGNADNARIVRFYRDCGHSEIVHDDVPWCAAFVGACIERTGMRGTRSLMARSYLAWGEAVDEARYGAIAVLSRGADPAAGHVGFVVGAAGDDVMLLGGNQSDSVTVDAFPRSRLLGCRWPSSDGGNDAPANAPPAEDEDLFAIALGHVLEMEGGYSQDAYDPGGPTNFGITLADFASWKGQSADGSAREQLKAELKRIAPETVSSIYRERYWRAGHCAELPAALALMHFDAGVNQGNGAAMRMLQSVIGARVDGEWGPETKGRSTSAPLGETLARYAELRRQRYRSLSHFWRFGRGWLARVDRTLDLARKLAEQSATPKPRPPQPKGDSSMTSTPVPVPADPAPKWWGESVTVWGALVTALATVLPAFGPVMGIDLTGELVQEAGSQIVTTVQAIAGLVGTFLTIYGRVRASQPLQRRALNIKL